MPAMHDEVLNGMNSQLLSLRDRMLTLHEFNMTHLEALDLVAPPEHHTILREAAKIAILDASENWFTLTVPQAIDGATGQRVMLRMRTHGDHSPPLVPRDPVFNREAPSATKVIKWLTERYIVGRKFGMAQHVLYTLARICDNGAQVRSMWPAVMFLCEYRSDNPRLQKWAERHGAFKAVSHAPKISPQLRQMIRETQALLTSASLIDKNHVGGGFGQVEISECMMSTFDSPDGGQLSRL